jgi:hypothetical protein
LATIIKNLEYNIQVPEQDILQSKEQLKVILRIALPFKDRMVFLNSETSYFTVKTEKLVIEYNKFLNDLPNDAYAIWKKYSETRAEITPILKKCTEIRNMRSVRLFPAGTKRSYVNYRKLSLDEKISQMRPVEFTRLFNPAKIDPTMSIICPIIANDEFNSKLYFKTIKEWLQNNVNNDISVVVAEYSEKLQSLLEYSQPISHKEIKAEKRGRLDSSSPHL